ncbi:MAG: chloride channel protein, partial [Proteobacteria bacterium]
ADKTGCEPRIECSTIAAALAAIVEHSILGSHPVLSAPATGSLGSATSILLYGVLGVAAALVSLAFTELLLSLRARVQRAKKLPPWLPPALGGLATGGLAVVAFVSVGTSGIAGGGYDTLTRALHGQLPIRVLAVLCGLKILATVCSYSSGGAGGIFAPVLFIGAMLGGVVGSLDAWLFGHDAVTSMTSFALVGMGAMFAGVVRAPMTSVLIVFEMTGSYGLVLPLMIANSMSYVLARKVRPIPIYEALLEQDGVRLPSGTGLRGSLQTLDVSAAMTRELVTLDSMLTVGQAAAICARYEHSTYPVIDVEHGQFLGLLSEARLQRTLAENGQDKPLHEVARRKEYALPDEPLLRAVARMNRLGVRQLPVLERRGAKLLGLIATSDV